LLLVGSVQAQEIIITKNPRDVEHCVFIAQVKSTFGHWGFAGGEKQVTERAAVLGADTVLITSSKATDWLTSGVAYKCKID
jgi:hypothetical protein